MRVSSPLRPPDSDGDHAQRSASRSTKGRARSAPGPASATPLVVKTGRSMQADQRNIGAASGRSRGPPSSDGPCCSRRPGVRAPPRTRSIMSQRQGGPTVSTLQQSPLRAPDHRSKDRMVRAARRRRDFVRIGPVAAQYLAIEVKRSSNGHTGGSRAISKAHADRDQPGKTADADSATVGRGVRSGESRVRPTALFKRQDSPIAGRRERLDDHLPHPEPRIPPNSDPTRSTGRGREVRRQISSTGGQQVDRSRRQEHAGKQPISSRSRSDDHSTVAR